MQVNNAFSNLSQNSQDILNSVDNNVSVQTVSSMTEESAASSEEILNSVNETTLALEEVARSAQSQSELAEKLNMLVSRFKV